MAIWGKCMQAGFTGEPTFHSAISQATGILHCFSWLLSLPGVLLCPGGKMGAGELFIKRRRDLMGLWCFASFIFLVDYLKTFMLLWPINFTFGILSLGSIPKNWKRLNHEDVLVTLFRLEQNWKQFKCLNNWRMGKWILIHSFNGLLHSHCSICYKVYAATWRKCLFDKVICRIQNYMCIHISLPCKNKYRKKLREIFYNINNVWVEVLGLWMIFSICYNYSYLHVVLVLLVNWSKNKNKTG